MMFFAAAGFFLALFLPWWTALLWAFALGLIAPQGWRGALHTAGAAFIVWSLSAYYHNARASGLIASRLSELLQLPHATLIFVVVGLLGAVLALPSYWVGVHLRALTQPHFNS